jgi:pimeloyl-ACP methyl ester carboxylesterase
MFRERILSCGKLSLNLASGPANGPALIGLHGVNRRWQCLLPLTTALPPRWQMHCLDQRGHGASDRADRYLVTDYAADVAALIRTEFTEPVILYGHSLGAMVAAQVAAAEPARVRAVVAEDPPFHTMGERIDTTPLLSYFHALEKLCGRALPQADLLAQLGEAPLRNPLTGHNVPLRETRDAAAIRFAAAAVRQLDPAVLQPIVAGQWLDGYDVEGVGRSLQCPILLLQADHAVGGMLIDDDVALWGQIVPDLTVVRFHGAGHMLHWQRTHEVASAVTAFLESLDL